MSYGTISIHFLVTRFVRGPKRCISQRLFIVIRGCALKSRWIRLNKRNPGLLNRYQCLFKLPPPYFQWLYKSNNDFEQCMMHKSIWVSILTPTNIKVFYVSMYKYIWHVNDCKMDFLSNGNTPIELQELSFIFTDVRRRLDYFFSVCCWFSQCWIL